MNWDKQNLSIENIDKQNLVCYDAIANEYGNEEHETCRDFDAGTHCFLEKIIKQNEISGLRNGLNYLDIGVGTGVSLDYLMPWLIEKNANIDVLDISKAMLSIVEQKFGKKINSYIHSSIHNFNTEKKYDLIVSTLCDPFLTLETITKVKDLLSNEGIALITIPTNTWAKKVRKENINQTVFHDTNRNKHISYSFCWSKADLIRKFEDAGLYNVYSRVILIDDINKKRSISKINKTLIQNEKRMPMLLTLMFINRNVSWK